MIHINTAVLRKDTNTFLQQVILYNETVEINTKEGNVMMISEGDYKAYLEAMEKLNARKRKKTE